MEHLLWPEQWVGSCKKYFALANTQAYCAEEAIAKKSFIVLAKSVSYKTFYLGDEKNVHKSDII